ncbi:MAG TPA: endolytic transglycosylase MltG [Burkholderiaceae bacterium]|nr:endolytic transglycosylase MltG [Burkholderiaceae bacterium]
MKKKGNSARVWVSFALFAAIALVVGGLVGRWYLFERPLPLNAERIEFRVAAGSSVRAIAQAAQVAGVAVNADAMVAAARITGAAQSLRAGRYAVERGITLGGLLAKLRAGDVLRERFTVVEGIAFREMRVLIAAQAELKQDSSRLSPAELLKAIGADGAHPEGLFAPDTYVYDPGTSDVEIYRQAYRAQMKLLHDAWASRAPDLPYTSPYEALIMASIVEKETGQSAERAMIAGVFVNRLKLGMLLQTDPSVIYGMGSAFDGNLRKRDLLTDGPYNTYTRAGLPPTPIALPGRASIEAALKPAQTEALYFVARGDGTSHFSSTLAQHNRAVDAYQRCCRR